MEANYKIFSDKVDEIFKNEISTKEIAFYDQGEADDFYRIISPEEQSSTGLFPTPNTLMWLLISINQEYMLYKLFYKLFHEYKQAEEYLDNGNLLQSARHAENLFLKWFNYFEKLSQLINTALGFPLNTQNSQKGRRACSYKDICKVIDKQLTVDANSVLPQFKYLRTLENRPIYNKVSEIRHDLVHRHLSIANFVGGNMYGPVVEKLPDYPDDIKEAMARITKQFPNSVNDMTQVKDSKKTKGVIRVTYQEGPKKLDENSSEAYSIEDINEVIEDATDLLVEIKHKMLDFGEKKSS